MKTTRGWMKRGLAGMSLALVALSGCQTWVPEPGITLPTGRYLQHPPQYIYPSPPFPQPNEMRV